MHRLGILSSRIYLSAALLLAASALLISCGDDRNREPTARIHVLSEAPVVGEWVEVDGSKSSDPDGDPLAYSWSLKAPSASEGELDGKSRARARFLADVPGKYTISLVVNDGEFKSEPTRTTITVEDEKGPQDPDVISPPDGEGEPDSSGDPDAGEEPDTTEPDPEPTDPDAPKANAGADQDGAVGSRVYLDGTATTSPRTDPEELSYFWSFTKKPDESNRALSIEKALTPEAWFVPDAAGEYQIRLDVRDGDLYASDTVTVSVTREDSSACLMISEYLHYPTGHNKAVAIYNCGEQTLDLSKYVLCLVRNDATSCSPNTNLARGAQDGGKSELAAGEVLKICAASADDSVKPKCDLVSGSNLNQLTGDDRFFVFEDTDGNNDFTGVDLLIDAFGQTRTQPSSEIWKGNRYKRCNFDLYDGDAAFNEEDYFRVTQLSTSDSVEALFDDFGAPPTEGC